MKNIVLRCIGVLILIQWIGYNGIFFGVAQDQEKVDTQRRVSLAAHLISERSYGADISLSIAETVKEKEVLRLLIDSGVRLSYLFKPPVDTFLQGILPETDPQIGDFINASLTQLRTILKIQLRTILKTQTAKVLSRTRGKKRGLREKGEPRLERKKIKSLLKYIDDFTSAKISCVLVDASDAARVLMLNKENRDGSGAFVYHGIFILNKSFIKSWMPHAFSMRDDMSKRKCARILCELLLKSLNKYCQDTSEQINQRILNDICPFPIIKEEIESMRKEESLCYAERAFLSAHQIPESMWRDLASACKYMEEIGNRYARQYPLSNAILEPFAHDLLRLRQEIHRKTISIDVLLRLWGSLYETTHFMSKMIQLEQQVPYTTSDSVHQWNVVAQRIMVLATRLTTLRGIEQIPVELSPLPAQGKIIGRIRVIPRGTDDQVSEALEHVDPEDIVVFEDYPTNDKDAAPVSGFITTLPPKVGSHAFQRASNPSHPVPYIYIPAADVLLKEYDGYWVSLELKDGSFFLKKIYDQEQIHAAQQAARKATEQLPPQLRSLPPADRQIKGIPFRCDAECAQGEISPKSERVLWLLKFFAGEAPWEVPEGFALNYGAYNQLLDQSLGALFPASSAIDRDAVWISWQKELQEAFSGKKSEEVTLREAITYAYTKAWDSKNILPRGEREEIHTQIQWLFLHLHMPQDIAQRIMQEVHAYFPNPTTLVIRSNMQKEDDPNGGGQGVFDSVGDVPSDDPDRVIGAMQQVFASLWSYEGVLYLHAIKINPVSHSAGIGCMKQIDTKKAGVLYTPVERYGGNRAVEGEGTSLQWVQGRIATRKGAAKDVVVTKAGECNEIWTQTYQEKYAKMTCNRGYTRKIDFKNGGDRGHVLSMEEAQSVFEMGQWIWLFYGIAQEIEWGIDEQGKQYLFQTRELPGAIDDILIQYLSEYPAYLLTIDVQIRKEIFALLKKRDICGLLAKAKEYKNNPTPEDFLCLRPLLCSRAIVMLLSPHTIQYQHTMQETLFFPPEAGKTPEERMRYLANQIFETLPIFASNSDMNTRFYLFQALEILRTYITPEQAQAVYQMTLKGLKLHFVKTLAASMMAEIGYYTQAFDVYRDVSGKNGYLSDFLITDPKKLAKCPTAIPWGFMMLAEDLMRKSDVPDELLKRIEGMLSAFCKNVTNPHMKQAAQMLMSKLVQHIKARALICPIPVALDPCGSAA